LGKNIRGARNDILSFIFLNTLKQDSIVIIVNTSQILI